MWDNRTKIWLLWKWVSHNGEVGGAEGEDKRICIHEDGGEGMLASLFWEWIWIVLGNKGSVFCNV
jgi:hypothetical protein